MYRGDANAAERLYRRALRLCECNQPRFDDEAGANRVALAVLELDRYDYKRAAMHARKALINALKSRDAPHISAANRLLANVAKDHLSFAKAKEHLQAASVEAGRNDLPFEKAAISHLDGWLKYQQAALENKSSKAAIEMFERATAEANRIGHLPYSLGARIGLVQCSLLDGSLKSARNRLDEAARALAGSQKHPDLELYLRLLRASAALQAGSLSHANKLFRQTASDAHRLQATSREADAWAGVGAAEFHRGKTDQAEKSWRKAQSLARECSPMRIQLVRKTINRNKAGIKRPPF
jgi:tetratricopeptide (TPR) repeat protein